ncbi:hypothetical protein [Tessaracoccus coleopterorum]|uniref:hypothetical protein n=1 Tax=Tessaracoccus coleopterorum TaxID=2714950 RepID=UPI001E3ADCFF|nr:hypothetical protein [Tessaracoccus coleopterorum]
MLVAGLTVPDVRERPADFQAQADESHRRFFSGVPGDEPAPTPATGEPRRHTVHTGTRPGNSSTPGLPRGATSRCCSTSGPTCARSVASSAAAPSGVSAAPST